MRDEYIFRRRRSGEGWRLVVLVAIIAVAVGGLIICSRNLEIHEPRGVRATRDRGVPARGAGDDPALGVEDLPLLSQPPPLATVPARPSRFSRGIWRRVEAMENDLLGVRRRLHQMPELANREVRTGAFVAGFLRKLGLEVQTGVAGTGVVAVIQGGRPGPVVAARASMDGVPVAEESGLSFASTEKGRLLGRLVPVSHAAGHDVEMAVLLGTAEILADLRQELPGAVKLIFQPAGEVAPTGVEEGAPAMIRAGVLDSPSVTALLALKVQPAIGVAQIAIDTSSGGGGVVPFRVEMRSPSAAACERPGPGCPDLIAAAAQLVLNLRNLPHTRMDASSRVLITVGAISAGQTGHFLPARLDLRGTIRWRRQGDRILAVHLVRQTVSAAATLSGSRTQVSFEQGGVLIGNNPGLARWTLGTAVRVLRREGIRISSVPPVTDPGFDLFRRRVPSVLIQLGVSDRGGKAASLRSPGFVVDERAIAVGVNLMANLLVDYLLDASGDVRGLEGASRPASAPAPPSAAPPSPPRGGPPAPPVRSAPTGPRRS